jgi:subfamily B ATP-binding cassette protein MsbA
MNFNQPLSGTIKIDGKDLHSLRLRDYRSYLGVVMQDNFLFDGTIAENIAFANPHATLEEIKTVSRIAHCDEFIQGFEQKYETVVGERGITLSGGQKQRTARSPPLTPTPRRRFSRNCAASCASGRASSSRTASRRCATPT